MTRVMKLTEANRSLMSSSRKMLTVDPRLKLHTESQKFRNKNQTEQDRHLHTKPPTLRQAEVLINLKGSDQRSDTLS